MTRTDSASRVIKAAPEVVYQAFVDPKAVAAWLPPEGMTGEIFHFEPRPGGRYRMALTYRGSDGAGDGKTTKDSDVFEGRFIELIPNQRVVQRAEFESEDPAFAGVMTITWALTPVTEGTQVSITCENVPPGISREDHDAGLRSTLANLAAFTEGA